jgi:hypothetical protein
MTVPTDLRRCTAHYIFDATHYDAANKWMIDQSKRLVNMPMTVGTAPVFTTRAGIACADLDNNYFFERVTPIPTIGSVVLKLNTNAVSADGSLDFITMRITAYAAGDHAALTLVEPWESYDYRYLTFQGSTATVRIGSRGGATAASAALAADTWQVATGVYSLKDKIIKMRIGTGTIFTAASTVGLMQFSDSRMRFGYLKATGGLVSGHHLSVAQIAFFHDDILANQLALANSLVASWS